MVAKLKTVCRSCALGVKLAVDSKCTVELAFSKSRPTAGSRVWGLEVRV